MPDREAKILRNNQKLTQFDDPTFLDLEEQSKNIVINQIHNNTVQNLIQNSTDKTQSVEQAMSSSGPDKL
jgi:tRNA A-37 threonylcarbamoyl transferase component Bud32